MKIVFLLFLSLFASPLIASMVTLVYNGNPLYVSDGTGNIIGISGNSIGDVVGYNTTTNDVYLNGVIASSDFIASNVTNTPAIDFITSANDLIPAGQWASFLVVSGSTAYYDIANDFTAVAAGGASSGFNSLSTSNPLIGRTLVSTNIFESRNGRGTYDGVTVIGSSIAPDVPVSSGLDFSGVDSDLSGFSSGMFQLLVNGVLFGIAVCGIIFGVKILWGIFKGFGSS